jgi:hypothetical protein
MDQRVDNERQPDSERLESPARRAPSFWFDASISRQHPLRSGIDVIDQAAIPGVAVVC